jgi:hypothetical protein
MPLPTLCSITTLAAAQAESSSEVVSAPPDPLHARTVECAAVAQGVGVAALALHDVRQDIHAPMRVPAHRELVFAPRSFRLRRWSLKDKREHHMPRNKHVQASGAKEGGGAYKVVTHEEGVGFFGRDWLRETLLHSEGLVACGKRGHGGQALDYLHYDVVLVRPHEARLFLSCESAGRRPAAIEPPLQ